MKKILLLMAVMLPFIFDLWGKDSDVAMANGEHEYVDLGLPSGTLWATCNVGANSPEEYGDYFAWGETETKEGYGPVNYKLGDGIEVVTKYVTNYTVRCKCGLHVNHPYEGYVDNKTELDPEDDAAYVNWGPQWRMPTKAQQDELVEECTWIWTTQNSVKGYLVTGPNGNTIFLPAAGYKLGDMTVDDSHRRLSYGFYWSRTLYSKEPFYAFLIGFGEARVNPNHGFRHEGKTIRAVRVSQ